MVSGIVALLLMLLFVAVWVWAWRPRHQQDFERAARLALDEDAAGTDGADAGDMVIGKPNA
jgi:cytochrome c oxidase cbb3-type subunit IV